MTYNSVKHCTEPPLTREEWAEWHELSQAMSQWEHRWDRDKMHAAVEDEYDEARRLYPLSPDEDCKTVAARIDAGRILQRAQMAWWKEYQVTKHICNRRDECKEVTCFHYTPHNWYRTEGCDEKQCKHVNGDVECVPVEEYPDDSVEEYPDDSSDIIYRVTMTRDFLVPEASAEEFESGIKEVIHRRGLSRLWSSRFAMGNTWKAIGVERITTLDKMEESNYSKYFEEEHETEGSYPCKD